MNRGRRGEAIFEDKEDYTAFISLLKELVETYNVRISAYSLMPNHYHLLVQTPDGNISRSMRHLNGVYTQRFNRTHHYDGQLFKGRYKSILVEGDSYLLELVRYIHRNPLEAGLVENLQKYPWSSHKGYLSNAKKWAWLYKGFILSFFGGNKPDCIRIYSRFVSEETSQEINKILSKKKLPSVMGNKSFIEKVKERFFSDKSHEEVPESRRQAPEVDRIIEEVCKSYHVKRQDLLASRRGYFNEPRNVAIYLIGGLRGEPLKGVGRAFGIDRNSTVSSVIERLNKEKKKNKKMSRRIETLKAKLAKGQV
jgi:REP element-mobilizing transposase RayT